MKKYLLFPAVSLLVVLPACHKINSGAARPFQSDAIVTTVAGNGAAGFMDGNGIAAELFLPMGVAADTMGNVYVADEGNSCIRKILVVGKVSTFAGNGTAGYMDGIATAAEFSNPANLVSDAQGNLYITEYKHNYIRKITPSGVVSTFAGNDSAGYIDGPANAARFNLPSGLAIDGQGNVYVGDFSNFRIRKISPGGIVTTVAGNGNAGHVDGPGSTAAFTWLEHLAADAQGNIYAAEITCIRKITPSGAVSTLAGSDNPGYADGAGATAKFDQLNGIAIDAQGNVYVIDVANEGIRKISPAGAVSTLTGNGILGTVDGSLSTAEFYFPICLTIDAQGNLYVGDDDSRLREVSTSGFVTTIAGNGITGFADGPTPSAEFNSMSGVTLDAQGNLYATDYSNNRVRKIQLSGAVSTFAGNSTPGFADGVGDSAQFNQPIGVAADLRGNVYVADAGNNCIRQITPDAIVLTYAGIGSPGFADGNWNSALFNAPFGVAVDRSYNVYVADNVNNRIRKIDRTGPVSTVAGTGAAGYVDGAGSTAQFNVPDAVAVDAGGNLYVTDVANNCIRKIDPGGVVSTLAGNGHPGFIDGTGKSAELKQPNGVAVDGKGNVYVADNANNCIRKITPAGVVTTVAGSYVAGYADGVGSAALFNHPFGIAIDRYGDLYVGDLGNNRIRKIHFP